MPLGSLVAVDFVDASNGWAVGSTPAYFKGGPLIVHTVDGGRTWESQDAGFPDGHVHDVAFADALHGWASATVVSWGEQSESLVEYRLLHTDDGGRTWVVQQRSPTLGFGSIAAADASRVWVSRWDSGGSVLCTKDGGATWSAQTAGAGSITELSLVDAAHLWAAAIDDGGSWVLRSTNGSFPTVASFSPITGPVGTAVNITGAGFTGATAVAFNGTAATTRAVVSDTQITATVPAGATSGTIAVTTPNGVGVSAGAFTVTGTALSINVSAPTGSTSYPVGADLTVSWTTSPATASGGEFGVWARSAAGGYYGETLVAASGGSSYGAALTLNVPVGGGYQAIVAWRAIAGSGAWTVFGTSPGSFAVTGTGMSINISAPAGSTSYPVGADLTVSWTTSPATASGEFGVYARSAGGVYYIGKLVAASGAASYSTGVTLDVPVGSGYEAIVAWRATAGSAWTVFGTSPGHFAVTGTGLAVGDPYQGGIIAYIDGSGLHGLIAAAADQGAYIPWYNGSYTATGATATALGTGMANTTAIIASQGGATTSYAAGLARAYTGGGYSDWYLPSMDELNELYDNQYAIGGFESAFYWSSSEVDAYTAWDQGFSTGNQYDSGKNDADGVRAVRTF